MYISKCIYLKIINKFLELTTYICISDNSNYEMFSAVYVEVLDSTNYKECDFDLFQDPVTSIN